MTFESLRRSCLIIGRGLGPADPVAVIESAPMPASDRWCGHRRGSCRTRPVRPGGALSGTSFGQSPGASPSSARRHHALRRRLPARLKSPREQTPSAISTTGCWRSAAWRRNGFDDDQPPARGHLSVVTTFAGERRPANREVGHEPQERTLHHRHDVHDGPNPPSGQSPAPAGEEPAAPKARAGSPEVEELIIKACKEQAAREDPARRDRLESKCEEIE